MIRSISSAQQTESLRLLISRQKNEVSKASMELATGLKSDVYTGRGSAPSQSLEFRSRMEANDSYKIANQTLATQLEVTSTALSDVRATASEFLGVLVSGDIASMNRDTLKASATSALDAIVNKLNTSYNGGYLFAGTATNQKPLTIEADRTVTYNGNDQNLSSRVTDDTVLNHGITADHPALRDVMGLLTSVINGDLDAMTPDEFATFQSDSAKTFAAASEQITNAQARLGDNQARLEKVITSQTDMSRLYTNAILDIEGVDAEEAAVRLEGLSIQLQSTFEVTARMSQMSFLNFMR